ncbi:helix-turn-helix domain-containing protein [Flavobacterium sp. 20NA77.7]|uniref:Helix-turn-helix domain-containing protein n=1 Tax=Flavobacterium nakdongensis TaxID=3073563 RepID=A0ABY9R953_9FLAO|nr:helix-turn-helix domain-containing protein [Flavobacterium sp. 20NA77.7]WMW77783.1 helix-turn-helix domain-containing protein [Flavobacterium sp. 20NA77.7]
MRYKLLAFVIVCLILFPQNKLCGQTTLKQQLLISKAQNEYISQPHESLKIALLLLKEANTNNEKIKLNLLVYKIYSLLGDYTNASNYLFAANAYVDKKSVYQNVKINIEKAALLKSIYLHKQSFNYLNKALIDIKKIKNINNFNEIKAEILFQELELLLHKKEYKKAHKIIEKKHIQYLLEKNIESKKRLLLIRSEINIYLGKFESNAYIIDELKKLINQKDAYFEIQVWNLIAKHYFYQRDYFNAIENALKIKKLITLIDNNYLLENNTETLALSYLALNKRQDYKLLNTKLLTIQNEIEKEEKEAINTVYNLINSEYINDYSLKKKEYNFKLYFSIGIFILSFFIFGLFTYKKFLYKKRLEEIFRYLDFSNHSILSIPEEFDTINKKNAIRAETEQLILNKLKKFETTKKFTNKDISLAVLAGQFETNTKYLSEIINKHYNINFNTYINNLRINFIVDKLKKEPNFCNYKISYLAEISGFSSHSSFATVFKSTIGISPIKFIELLKNETNDTFITSPENE